MDQRDELLKTLWQKRLQEAQERIAQAKKQCEVAIAQAIERMEKRSKEMETKPNDDLAVVDQNDDKTLEDEPEKP